MNPCPCGYLGASGRHCRCTPDQVSRYQGKLSGPLIDRIDLHVEVPALAPEDLLHAPPGEATDSIRDRCTQARALAERRQGTPNQALAGQDLDRHVLLESTAAKFLQNAARQLGWSARGTHRTLKIARTIADLAGSEPTALAHVAEAMQYRRALKTV